MSLALMNNVKHLHLGNEVEVLIAYIGQLQRSHRMIPNFLAEISFDVKASRFKLRAQ